MINDSKVLDEYGAVDIAQRAAVVGVSIITNGNRIVGNFVGTKKLPHILIRRRGA
jgi:hypothetical protein